jgi:hypothetical protein
MEIILLAKSKMYNNFCVAGINRQTGEWIRLVSKDETILCAVPSYDLTYSDNSQAKVLDIVNVETLNRRPLFFQPENIMYDDEYYWHRIGSANLDEVNEIIQQSNDPFVFFNQKRAVSELTLQQIKSEKMYSLKLIFVNNAILTASEKYTNGPLKYSLSFDFNGIEYQNISITDVEFVGNFDEEDDYYLEALGLVISLGHRYKDGNHYKLIAKIFEL